MSYYYFSKILQPWVLPPGLNFLPSFKALNTSITAMHEYVGMLVYRMGNCYK